MTKRKVDFIGVGAPKCGTSWLARCLDDHPDLTIPVKETHFFSREQEYEKGLEYYASLLRTADPKARLLGEFCPNYLSREKVARRVHAYNHGVKLVAVLRDPIDRAYSHFLHEVRAGQVSLERGILDWWDVRPEYHEHGLYAASLERYFELFDQSQILCLIYEELCDDPAAGVKSVYEFLGVDPLFISGRLERRVNATRVPRVALIERAFDVAADALSGPEMRGLRRVLADTGITSALRRLNTRRDETVARGPSESERAELASRFASDVRRLRALLGRPLPWPSFE